MATSTQAPSYKSLKVRQNVLTPSMTETVGVANHPAEDMLKMQAELAKYDISSRSRTNSRQQYRLPEILVPRPRTSDEVNTPKTLGFRLRPLSPKSTKEPIAEEYHFSSYPMEELEPTLDMLEEVAKARNVSVSAMALNCNMCKGILPVVGIRKAQQAEEALRWRLRDDGIRRIDGFSSEGKTTRLLQQG